MKWIAYQSDETGRYEIYVRPFLAGAPSGAPSLGDGKWQVSKDGASAPTWRTDQELLMVRSDSTLLSVEVNTTPTFRAGTPQRLFQFPAGTAGMDVAQDGRRILLEVPAEQEKSQPITVVLNWDAGLKSK
jgi:hypothetical protein